MKYENKEYPKVRVTKQAHAHLARIIPAVREERGLNVSMTDFVSELILSTPIPQPTRAVEEKKRRTRKAVNQSTAAPAL